MSRTVRVRIAVAVEKDEWNAAGWSGGEDDTVSATAFDGLDVYHSNQPAAELSHLFWVEADLVIPEATVVEGHVLEPAE